MTTLVCLVSKQIPPNYLAALHVRPSHVVLCYTKDTHRERKALERAFQGVGLRVAASRQIDAFDLTRIRQEAEALLASADLGPDPVLNYTGGTKQMSIAFHEAWRAAGRRSLYFDTQNERVWWAESGGYRSERFERKIGLRDYFVLDGHEISAEDAPEAIATRLPLAAWILEQHRLVLPRGQAPVRKLLTEAARCNKDGSRWPGGEVPGIRVHVTGRGAQVEYEGQRLELPPGVAASFFAGGWLEDFVFCTVSRSRRFDEVKARVSLRPLQRDGGEAPPANELDVAAIRNGTPYFVECKAGNVLQADVNKIDAVARIYGGRYAQPFLASLWPPTAQARRLRELNVRVVEGPVAIARIAEALLAAPRART
jgi:hypothetical protein